MVNLTDALISVGFKTNNVVFQSNNDLERIKKLTDININYLGNLKLTKNDPFSIVYVGEEQKEFSEFLLNGISNFYRLCFRVLN